MSDEVFEVYRRFYSYDRTELNAVAKPIDSGSAHWTKERIEFDAAYGGERMIAYLFLPANAAPPYQTVVYFPGGTALTMDSHESEMWYVDFLIRSGRALLYPIYKGTFERRGEGELEGPSAERDHTIQRFKDLSRSIDYLETREDIDREKIAYYGFSWGAADGPIFTALEKRFRVSILFGGGFYQHEWPAEVDPFHFAPRARTPVLMINGRDDFASPLEVSQKPMFRALGAPEQDKRHALIEGGHLPPLVEVIKESLDWLDRYLGRVRVMR
ncbi:MAG: alpha/beta hydrolase family protein [Vicinamibacteria bacterium]